MKDKFYKGILIGAVSYPLFNFLISTLDIVSTWIENKINLSSAKMIVEAQELQKKEEEEVNTQCIGFQYTPAEEKEEYEENKKGEKK